MTVATAILVAGLVIAAVGTGVAVQASRAQAKAQRKAAGAAADAEALKARRARRRVIRESRIARGEAANLAFQVGAGETSGFRGGVSSLDSQAGANLGFSTRTEDIGRKIKKFSGQASRAASRGALGSGLSSLGGALFSNSSFLGGFGCGSSNFGNRGGGITGGGR